MESTNKRLVILVEGAVITAIAMALSWIPIEAPNAAFDLSLGLVPLAVFAARRGAGPAIIAGAVWGLLHIVGGKAYILTPIQFIIEYPLAFASSGVFGLFAARIRGLATKVGAKAIGWIACASITATLTRWFWHFLAGGLVWAEYAPPDMNPWIYSLIMNGLSFIGNAVMLIIVMTALTKTAPRLFRA